MILSKETNIATSVVVGKLENQRDWQSADGIYVNRDYSLIYTSDLVPNKVAVKKFGGFYIQECLASLFSEFAGNWNEISQYRRETLGALVEVWGNANMGNRHHKHPDKGAIRLVKKSTTSRKHQKELDFALGQYVACHYNELRDSSMAIHVQDTHDEELLSPTEFEAYSTANLKAAMAYDMYCAIATNMGAFVIEYPSAEEIEKLTAAH